MLEFDKVYSTLDFLLIVWFYLFRFCLIHNMPDLLLKFFILGTVFFTPVLELIISTAVAQNTIGKNQGIETEATFVQILSLLKTILISVGDKEIGITRSIKSSCSSRTMELII